MSSHRGLFKTSVYNDYKNLENNAKAEEMSIEQYLVSKYPEAFRDKVIGHERVKPEYRGLSDILHGCSKTNVNLGYGHYRSGYWSNYNKRQRETFAQHGRMMYDSNKDVIRMYCDLFPTVFAEINNSIKN